MWWRIIGAFIVVVCISCVDTGDAYADPDPDPLPQGDTITMTKLTSPAAGKLKGEGTYAVVNQFVSIFFYAKETKTLQSSNNKANVVGNNWDHTLSLVKGNYDGWGVLTTYDAAKKQYIATLSNKGNQNVN